MFEVVTLKDNAGFRDGFDPTSLIGIILGQLQNLFAGADPGHYENGRFIPGDLQQRLQYSANRIGSYGVANVADQNIIYDILTEMAPAPFNQGGSWQGNLDEYLIYLKNGVQNGTIIPGQTSNPLAPGTGNVTGGGFAYNFATFGNLLPVLLIGGLGFYAFRNKKKSKKGKR